MTSYDADKQEHPKNTLAQKLAVWADILRDCSVRGLHYAANVYERDRYQKIQAIALEMLAEAAGKAVEDFEPLRAALFSQPGPFPCGDAAVIDEHGKLLLIRRTDNGLWAMPGGALEVGETPAQGVVREVLEETGVTCEPVALVGVYDSRLCGTPSLLHLYQFSFLCRPLTDGPVIDPTLHAHETLGKGWFSEHELPADLDPGHIRRIPQAFRVWHGDMQAHFDRLR